MKTNNYYKSNIIVLQIALIFLISFNSCEPNHELPLVIPEVENSSQYIDMYCGQNSTSFVTIFGVQAQVGNYNHSSEIGRGHFLQNGRMDCFLFRIHDNDDIYDGVLDLSMQHRIHWLDICNKMDGIHITTYKSNPDDFDENGWKLLNKDLFSQIQSHYLATNTDPNGMFFSSNYVSVPIESIRGILNPDDQILLDEYRTKVKDGHIRVFVYSITDEYLETLETSR